MSTKANNENKAKVINHLLLVSGLFYKNELIELNSCGYDIQKKQISTETVFYIQPNNIQNKKELMEKSQIDKNKDPDPQYISLEETINKLNKIIKENYTSKNHNFAIIYVNKDLVDILSDKLEVKNFSSFNIFDTFNDYYHKKYETLNKILSELNLKQNSNAPPCPKELKTMARIINKMVKEGKTFYAQEQKEKENTDKPNINNKSNDRKNKMNKIDENNLTENKNEENREISQSETTISDPDIQCYYIRFKNFPDYINKIDVKDLLYQFELDDNDIVLSYNIFGKKTGDVIIRLFNL